MKKEAVIAKLKELGIKIDAQNRVKKADIQKAVAARQINLVDLSDSGKNSVLKIVNLSGNIFVKASWPKSADLPFHTVKGSYYSVEMDKTFDADIKFLVFGSYTELEAEFKIDGEAIKHTHKFLNTAGYIGVQIE